MAADNPPSVWCSGVLSCSEMFQNSSHSPYGPFRAQGGEHQENSRLPEQVIANADSPSASLLEAERQIRVHLELYGHELTAEQRERFEALAGEKRTQAIALRGGAL